MEPFEDAVARSPTPVPLWVLVPRSGTQIDLRLLSKWSMRSKTWEFHPSTWEICKKIGFNQHFSDGLWLVCQLLIFIDITHETGWCFHLFRTIGCWFQVTSNRTLGPKISQDCETFGADHEKWHGQWVIHSIVTVPTKSAYRMPPKITTEVQFGSTNWSIWATQLHPGDGPNGGQWGLGVAPLFAQDVAKFMDMPCHVFFVIISRSIYIYTLHIHI